MKAETALQRADGLTWKERWFALRLALAVPLVHASLMLFGYRRTQALLRPFRRRRQTARSSPEDVEAYVARMRKIAQLVRLRSPLAGSCLSQSMSLSLLLSHQGVESVLRFGTRLDEGRLEAHAWLEWAGKPLNALPGIREYYRPLERPSAKNDQEIR